MRENPEAKYKVKLSSYLFPEAKIICHLLINCLTPSIVIFLLPFLVFAVEEDK